MGWPTAASQVGLPRSRSTRDTPMLRKSDMMYSTSDTIHPGQAQESRPGCWYPGWPSGDAGAGPVRSLVAGGFAQRLELVVANAPDVISQMFLGRQRIMGGDRLDDSFVLVYGRLEPVGDALGEVPDPDQVGPQVLDQCPDPAVVDLLEQDVIELRDQRGEPGGVALLQLLALAGDALQPGTALVVHGLGRDPD